MKKFRIIPRVAIYENGEKENLLFLPDIPAQKGFIVCYARVGEHSEASFDFYRDTVLPNPETLTLFDWYVKNKCGPDDKPIMRQRLALKTLAKS